MNKTKIILICLIFILICTIIYLLSDYSIENNEISLSPKKEEISFWTNSETIHLVRLYTGDVDISSFEELFEEICDKYLLELHNSNPTDSVQQAHEYFEKNKDRIFSKTGISNEDDFYVLLKFANRIYKNKNAKKVSLNLNDYRIEDNYFKFSAILYDGNSNQYNFNINFIMKKNNNEPSIVIIPIEREQIYE